MNARKKGLARVTPRWVVVVAAVVAIPAIYGGLLIWSNQDPTHRLDDIPAAIVNDDVAAKSGDDTLNLGGELVDELLDDDDNQNFAWQEMGSAQADTALRDGSVLVVMHIPSSFSSDVASLGGDDPGQALSAELTITTNDGANMIIGNVASSVGSAVNTALADKVRAEYLDKIYVGFNDIHDNITEAADGARDLSDGTSTASDGAAELRVGLGTLSDGTLSLSDGAGAVRDGAGKLASGAERLDDGLSALDAKVADLPAKVAQLAQGAQDAADGASSLAAGTATLADGATALAGGARTALAGAKTLHGKLADLEAGTDTLASGAGDLATGLATLRDNYDALSDDQRKALIAHLAAGSEQVSSGASATHTAVSSLEAGAAALVGDTDDGTGLATLAARSEQVAGGATRLDKAAGQLAAGLDTLAEGTGTLATQMPTLTSAVADLADGGDKLATASTTLASGTTTLAEATTKLTDGASDALAGAAKLDDGLSDLADGADELADGLKDGANEIPTYTDREADHLSETAAAPVDLVTQRTNEVPTYGYGLAGYFSAIALWVGAVAFYLVFDPISKRRLTAGQPAWRVVLGSIWPGAVASLLQGGALAWVIVAWLGITPANPAGFAAVLALSSLTFFALNQALVGLFGLPGRFLSLILLILQVASAAGMYPVQTMPAFLQTMHEWLPISYTVGALRSLIAGGQIGLAQVAPALGGWLAIALLTTTGAALQQTRRQRKLNIEVIAPLPDPAQ